MQDKENVYNKGGKKSGPLYSLRNRSNVMHYWISFTNELLGAAKRDAKVCLFSRVRMKTAHSQSTAMSLIWDQRCWYLRV